MQKDMFHRTNYPQVTNSDRPSGERGPIWIQQVLRKWWADNPDLHYPMTAYASIISVGSTMWGLLFIMLGGATDPQASSLVPISWACLILGGVGCFFLLPEFFLYISLRSTFEQICTQDNRTEIIRRRKELEDAAESW